MEPNNPESQTPQSDQKAAGAYKYLQPYKTKGQIIIDNFLGGLFWSFGSFIGLAAIAVLVGYLISRIDLIPIIGSWIASILQDATSRLQLPVQ